MLPRLVPVCVVLFATCAVSCTKEGDSGQLESGLVETGDTEILTGSQSADLHLFDVRAVNGCNR